MNDLNHVKKEHTLIKSTELMKEKLENFKSGKSNFNRLSTGIKNLDSILSGIGRTNFMVIASRPTIKKHLFLIQLVSSIIKQNKSVLFISTQLDENEIIECLYSNLNQIEHKPIIYETTNTLKILSNSIPLITNNDIYLINNKLTPNEINLCAIKLNELIQNNLGAIIIDDIYGLISNDITNTKLESINQISSDLKSIALELKLPVIVSANIDSKVETRIDKRPQLFDIIYGDQIEYDADKIIFLFKNYFNEHPNDLEIIIAKNRTGNVGSISCYFDPKTSTIF